MGLLQVGSFKIQILGLVVATALSACGDEEEEDNAPLEVIGVWDDNFGGTTEITAESWGALRIDSYDNDENVVIAQNPSDDAFNPDAYNRIVWTDPVDGEFYGCFVDFGLSTAAEAESSTATADATDPANSGCGAFAWTLYTEASGS